MRTRLLSLGLGAVAGVLALAPAVASAQPAADTAAGVATAGATVVAVAPSAPSSLTPASATPASDALAGQPSEGAEAPTGTTPGQSLDVPAPVASAPQAPAVRARTALSHARDLFQRGGTSGAHGATWHHGRDATLVLTQLRHHVHDLTSSADRRAARAILARPTYGKKPRKGEHAYTVREQQPVCDAHVCIHYVTSTRDRVATTDANANAIPDYVDQAQEIFAQVWSTEVATLGYHRPMDDSALAQHGVDGKLDVYLQDLATDTNGLYGYCAPDTSNRRSPGYCVLENDYAEAPFQRRSPRQNFEVTAAHEFFHAVQFSYDSYESPWLMEGTAAWMEDEVFDEVDDNRQYLAQSPLTDPELPLNYANFDPAYSPYGGWIFWRFLSEWQGPGAGEDPSVIRGVWNRAASTSSLGALSATLAARHTSLTAAFRSFGTWTRNPRHFFAEGAFYPPARTAKSFLLGSRHPGTGVWGAQLSHLSRAFVRFRPATTLHGAWRLRLHLDMADRSRGSLAQVVTHHPDGTITVHAVRLDRSGEATTSFVFDRSRVSFLDLDLVNTSVKLSDDFRPTLFSVTAVR